MYTFLHRILKKLYLLIFQHKESYMISKKQVIVDQIADLVSKLDILTAFRLGNIHPLPVDFGVLDEAYKVSEQIRLLEEQLHAIK